MMKFWKPCALVSLALSWNSFLSNAEPAPVPQEGLNATVWVQTSAEAQIAARQAYFLAARQLDAALRNKRWSAAIEQGKGFETLPPAVILDLDETVLDNSPYQARLVRDNASYSGEGWAAWVAQASAEAIPGAQGFLKYAHRRGVRIYYVSNRGKAEEAATRENLRRLGLPLGGPADHVLMSGERPDWTSDKTSRRRFVAKTHRVLLLVGDDLNDFVPAKPLTVQARRNLLQRYANFWGERWIMLSNPLYGSWEGALWNFQNGLSRDEMLRRKYEALQTRESSVAPRLSPSTPATR
jgi:5'-nucleotidase (lipoprotein e(P4) family)